MKDLLPIRKIDPPEPRSRIQTEPLAIRFGRQVAASNIDGWVRLEQKVSRSIVNAKAKEFGRIHGVEFRVALDHEDVEDLTSDRFYHLFCKVVPVTDIPIEVG